MPKTGGFSPCRCVMHFKFVLFRCSSRRCFHVLLRSKFAWRTPQPTSSFTRLISTRMISAADLSIMKNARLFDCPLAMWPTGHWTLLLLVICNQAQLVIIMINCKASPIINSAFTAGASEIRGIYSQRFWRFRKSPPLFSAVSFADFDLREVK